MWAWLFHMKVATRSPAWTPSLVRAAASCSARLETWKNVASSTPSGVTVKTFFSEYTYSPWRMMPLISSGASCIVLCTDPPQVPLRRCYKLSTARWARLPGEAVGLHGRRQDAGALREMRVDGRGGAATFGDGPDDQALSSHGVTAGED